MKKVNITKYKCSICEELYNTEKEARSCEDRKVTKDRGVKIGDTVLIINGDRSGQKAIVEKIWVIDKYWGHYAWKRYWHTVCLSAKIIEGYGNRILTFDSYKVI